MDSDGEMSVSHSSPLSSIHSDVVMLNDSPSLTDQVKLLAEWMKSVPFLVPMIVSFIAANGAEAKQYVETLQVWLRQSPVQIDFSRRKSQADTQTLWSRLESEDYPYARFLLEMWEFSNTRQPSTEDEIHAWLLDEAFSLKFEGDSVDLFCETMKEYASAYNPESFYGRIIAWHGPSGAGKSKGVDALKDRFPVYSICFRSSDDPSDGWPPGDTPAYNFFANCKNGTGEERVAAFLGAFLEVAVSEIKQGPLAWKYRYKVGEAYVNSARGVLFTRVAKRAEELLHTQVNDIDMEPGPSSPSPAPTIPVEPEYRYQQLWKRFCQVPALALTQRKPMSEYCFIALDECTDLPNVELMALRHILEAGHNVKSLWFILLSTNAEMHSLRQTYSLVQPSARFARLQCLPAWCHFGFGQLSPPEPDTPRECLRVDYLRRVGRPLFATYKTTMVAYSNARKKLFSPQHQFNPESRVHVFTAFSHRILLDIGSTVAAHRMAADSVESNLRYTTRIDGEIVRTVCPSEPLLSLVAADALNTGDNYVYGLRILVDAVKSATIERGQEAEIYCRLIIIRARDVACRGRLESKVEGYDDEDSFSQTSYMVRLITLAEHIDALVHLKHINSSDADRLRRFASGYYVNLTHMVRFREPVSAIPQTLLRSLFIRGSGVQCCHGQPVIDGFYVAYGGDLDKPFDLNRFIMIPWQSKAKAAAASQAELVACITGPMQIDSAGRRCKPAQLVIVMDLNAKPAFRTGNKFLQVTERKVTPPTYPKRPQENPTTLWGGYAMGPNEEEPMTWCLDIRGHGGDSYPCTRATAEESSVPDFSALFEQVGRDIVANSIIAVASRSADACLHPLIDL
ncbi:hypothetical protein GGX14DRAFT_465594 [Mycena pura]|uniref:Uncharacterized protein n=1 Tax=Mycena pura TaxID=153505 RepID=A0AAD6V2D8_9AGAR|nr:hypothetical protein GGX14DRAFT_465594 [Mycena pura]